MRPSDLTRALRRDDLTIHGSYNVDELDCVQDFDERFYQERVLLLHSDSSGDIQALEVVDDYCPCDECGVSYVYVPLAFGPVQEDL
jgi:hypothetical protein